MPKQVYDVINNDESIDIFKNDTLIYSVLVVEKSINLKCLYDKMAVSIEDEILVKKQLVHIGEPKNDADRIYNNIIDFMNNLLYSINEKLITLRAEKHESIFN